MLCYAMLCYAMLCYAMLCSTLRWEVEQSATKRRTKDLFMLIYTHAPTTNSNAMRMDKDSLAAETAAAVELAASPSKTIPS